MTNEEKFAFGRFCVENGERVPVDLEQWWEKLTLDERVQLVLPSGILP